MYIYIYILACSKKFLSLEPIHLSCVATPVDIPYIIFVGSHKLPSPVHIAIRISLYHPKQNKIALCASITALSIC